MTSGNNIETEYLGLNAKNEWPVLYQVTETHIHPSTDTLHLSHFQRIRSKSLKDGGSYTEAVKPQNKSLNRYRDVSPYDHSRVVLGRGPTDYINANFIWVEGARRRYILTQGPLPNTVSHFWLMVWEQRAAAVLMLNKLVEKKQEKCCQYWPAEVGGRTAFADVGLEVEYVSQRDHSYYLTRTFRLTDTETGASRDILQVGAVLFLG